MLRNTQNKINNIKPNESPIEKPNIYIENSRHMNKRAPRIKCNVENNEFYLRAYQNNKKKLELKASNILNISLTNLFESLEQCIAHGQ